ncbi:HD domain protein [Synechococcus sp. PCC 7335]|uniref:HD domain-containing protein n=1 Tax=Synechococcus sp. (strain ATCC 29403 / PCC 7335) TaxID=91464 RepID=UPI00017EBFC8|nr:HD domain-containing protein [Synechococcus sp. PCC 7335]EDX84075.1 HD domain protein [Synechococcus sp. PCC 7335]
MSRSIRTYHDPLHGAITLDGTDEVEALLKALIDTPEFQRLRRIRQLGPASLTFHGAEMSRFTHSLGALAIARRAFDRLAALYEELRPHRATVLCAALLHDIGHGPFSHTAEEIFGSHHEQWTMAIVEHSLAVRPLLDTFHPSLWQAITQVYTHTHPIPCVWQLVSSQLDCDRIDYLMRDSYFTGAAYGQLDLDRIVLALDYEPVSQQLVVQKKGLAAIEHYLVVRSFMYAQIYNHSKNLSATWILEQAFARARELLIRGELTADQTVTAWLGSTADQLSLEDYLAGDDIVFTYHLQRWQQQRDPALCDLCQRFLDRRLLKVVDVTYATPAERESLLESVQQQLLLEGVEAHRYSGLKHTWSKGYSVYQRGIKIQTSRGLKDIKQLSALVQTLSEPAQRTWLIHPKEIQVGVCPLPDDQPVNSNLYIANASDG